LAFLKKGIRLEGVGGALFSRRASPLSAKCRLGWIMEALFGRI
jgi:hypothetical protein